MRQRLRHTLQTCLPHRFRLILLFAVCAAGLILTLCRRADSTIDPMLEQRLLELDPSAALKTCDSLNLSDSRSVALAAYFRGRRAYEEGNPKRATAELKMAESLIDTNEVSPLNFHIANKLFFVNYYYGENNIAGKYALRTRRIAFDLKDSLKIYSAITYHAAYLLEIGKSRQAIDTIMTATRYAQALTGQQKAKMYNNIGYMFRDSDINISRRYYEKAIECYPINAALANLATIRAREGDMASADSLWDRALSTNSDPLRLHILTDIYNTRCELADYQGACRAADSLVTLKDRMERRRMEHDVNGEQLRFDHQWQQAKSRQHIRTLIFSIIILILVALLTWLYYFYRRSKMEKALVKEHILASALEQRIEVLQKEASKATQTTMAQADEIKQLKEQSEEISKLNLRLESLRKKQAEAYANGRKRFNEVMAGSPIVSWHKRDIDDCVEYYELVDMAYMASLDTLYAGLTSKNKLFMILAHVGKTDAEIQQIFGVGPNAIRTLRSRIKAKQC